ncbi:MAG TPA: CPBP family intramembrane glutamic endopeptidase [Thermoanaerobaculia bacterium]|nr:CPBP family intramembrane glutamic endopeptidase [Thermoanaerobaculia bacterium]
MMSDSDTGSGRFKAIVWIGLLALGLSMLVQGVWAVLLLRNLATSPAGPWAIPAMALLLWLMWRYLGGKGWPSSTSEARRRYLRANPVPGRVFAWALLAGTLSLVSLAGLWIVLFQLVKIHGNRLPDFSQYPWLTVALALAMASLVGAVAEEACFRGYFQGTLERGFGVPAAIGIQCLVMALPHGLTQGFNWPTLLFYLLVDLMLGVTAYLTQSIRPGILIHSVGLLTFFSLIWPADRSRRLIAEAGADAWFWIHAGQAILFAALAVVAFRHLAKVTQSIRSGGVH